MTTSEERVALAAKMLDEYVPGWHNMIDLDTLEMGSCAHCVLGQVFGWENEQRIKDIVEIDPYKDMYKEMPGYTIGSWFLEQVAGRNAHHPTYGAFGAANCLWVSEIADRRASEDNYND